MKKSIKLIVLTKYPNFFQAEEITLTIGQAFELAYKKFLSEGKSETPEEKLSRYIWNRFDKRLNLHF